MRFLVLMSVPESIYGDTPTSYSFPARYRQFFAPLSAGEPMLAIIYEPRGKGRLKGRQAYIGWAALAGPPQASPDTGVRGEPLWVVNYVDRMQEYPTAVARDLFGEPIEAWLRAIAPESRDIRTSGASVRFITEAEAQRISELGYAAEIGSKSFDYPEGELGPGAPAAEERSRRLVSALERDARFRGSVMSAYAYQCAISGFGIGAIPQGRATRLLDAAHIRPVSERGSDSVSNGLALTPTLHRLFDQGLFTIVDRDSDLELVVSPLLEPTMIKSQDGAFSLPLRTGLRLKLPAESHLRPRPADLRYHGSNVFKGADSLL